MQQLCVESKSMCDDYLKGGTQPGTHPSNMTTTAPPHLKSAETDYISEAESDAL